MGWACGGGGVEARAGEAEQETLTPRLPLPEGREILGGGPARDYARAFELFKKAADQLEAEAMMDLSWMHEQIQGYSSYAKALKLNTMALSLKDVQLHPTSTTSPEWVQQTKENLRRLKGEIRRHCPLLGKQVSWEWARGRLSTHY